MLRRSMVKPATEPYAPIMLKLAPRPLANPGKTGITVLWLASAKNIAKVRRITVLGSCFGVSAFCIST
jgi:hypothetical protein